MKKTLAIGLAAFGLLAGASTVDAAHGRGDLTIGLNGANEAGIPGDPDGSGKIELSFFINGGPSPESPYVCYDLTTRNVDGVGGLHIHEVSGDVKNPRKDAGPIAVNLLDGPTVSDELDNCITISQDLLEDIIADPSDYYVNAHNDDFMAGAIRGQLHAFN